MNTTFSNQAFGRNPAFRNALRGELAWARGSRVVWTSTGAWATCVVIFAYLVSYLTTVGGDWYSAEQQAMFVKTMLPISTGYYVLASLPMYGAPQFAILGAILGASGYAAGTLATVAARFRARTPLVAARLLTLVLVAAVTAVFTLLASVLSSLGVAALSGNPAVFPPVTELITALLVIWLVTATFLALGFAIGTLLRRTLAAAILALVWILGVETLLLGMLAPVVEPLTVLQGYLPVGATTSLAAGLIPAGQQTIPAMTAATGPVVALLVLLGWTAAAGSVAFMTFRRRDLA